MDNLSTFIERNYRRKPPRISVVGDAMVDEYYYVHANRVSPEFPIPVLQSTNNKPARRVPGGAANVCAQFLNFNVDLEFFGFINGPEFLITPYNCLPSISHEYSVELPKGSSIPIKKRYYQDQFPLVRLDEERNNYGLLDAQLGALQDKLFENFSQHHAETVVLSDYGKGVFNCSDEKIQRWLNLDMFPITIVDPKGGPVSRWKGCSIIKPNAQEAKQMSGTDDWRQQCRYFVEQTECQAVVITQAGEGVVGIVMGKEFEYRPKKEIKAESVIGAGDCFVAFLAMGMAFTLDIVDAVDVAFEASTFYVKEKYNEPIHPHQLFPDKFVEPKWLQTRNYKLVMTNGCYDILHWGHINTLNFAKSKGDKLVVALNSDESVRRQKKPHPLVNTLEDRKEVIAALDCVDFVIDFDEDNPYNAIKQIRPDVLVKGAEWETPIGSDLVKEVHLAPMIEGVSTTKIIEKLRGST